MTRAGITRERLASVGAALADEIGFEHLTAAEVARRFGVQTASLYSHVRNTAELRELVTLHALAELADRVADSVAGRSGIAALTGLADANRAYAREHPGRYAATLQPLDPSTAAASAGPRHARLVLAVLRDYALEPPQAVHAVRLVSSTIRGFITLEASGSFDHSTPDPEDSWRRIIDVLDASLRAWPDS